MFPDAYCDWVGVSLSLYSRASSSIPLGYRYESTGVPDLRASPRIEKESGWEEPRTLPLERGRSPVEDLKNAAVGSD